MIVLFTDFGPNGPYLGQVRAALAREAPNEQVIDLLSNAPAFDPRASAYLLPAYVKEFPRGVVFLGVVDPGVGSDRAPVMLEADGRWFVGPDNGLFALLARRAETARWWTITWRPDVLSASFHGRDLFAPVAAGLALGKSPPGEPRAAQDHIGADWPDDLERIVYVDHFGNAVTGLRAEVVPKGAILTAAGHRLGHARTFSDVPPGNAFWYENANALAEISVNRGRADEQLGLDVGTEVQVLTEEV